MPTIFLQVQNIVDIIYKTTRGMGKEKAGNTYMVRLFVIRIQFVQVSIGLPDDPGK